jgi:hypothetical protein
MWDNLSRMLGLWLQGHAKATIETYCSCAIAGIAGGALLALVTNPVLMLPYRDGRKLRLGFVGTLIGGALWGMFADHSVPVGMAAGALGPSSLLFIIERAIPGLLRVLLHVAKEEIEKHDS